MAIAVQIPQAQTTAAEGTAADQPTCARALPYTSRRNSITSLQRPTHATRSQGTIGACPATTGDPLTDPGPQLAAIHSGTMIAATDNGPAFPSPAEASPQQTGPGSSDSGQSAPVRTDMLRSGAPPADQAAYGIQQQYRQGVALTQSGFAPTSIGTNDASGIKAPRELVGEDDGLSHETMQVGACVSRHTQLQVSSFCRGALEVEQ